ncbi:hypothetical protein U1Q18_021296 [Sarracenia purpurea var. burkii]
MRDLDAIDSNWEDLWTDCIGIFVRNNRIVREDSGMNVIGKGARKVPRNRGGCCHRRNGGESVGAGEEAFSSEGCMGFVWTEMAVGSQEEIFSKAAPLSHFQPAEPNPFSYVHRTTTLFLSSWTHSAQIQGT